MRRRFPAFSNILPLVWGSVHSYPYSFQKATFFLRLKKSFRSTAWPFEISGQRSLLTLLIAKYIILFELL